MRSRDLNPGNCPILLWPGCWRRIVIPHLCLVSFVPACGHIRDHAAGHAIPIGLIRKARRLTFPAARLENRLAFMPRVGHRRQARREAPRRVDGSAFAGI